MLQKLKLKGNFGGEICGPNHKSNKQTESELSTLRGFRRGCRFRWLRVEEVELKRWEKETIIRIRTRSYIHLE